MPKKNNKINYWEEREKNNLTVELMKDAEVSREMKRILENVMNTCIKEIESFYTRFADKEGITVKEAKKRVDQYDVIAHQNMAKQYVKDKDFTDEANERLRLYNASMRINREQLLLNALNTHMIAATNDIHHVMNDYLEDGAIRELKRQAGLLGNVHVKSTDIKAIVNASYYDATWSERLWSNMDEVRKIVDETVLNTVLRGRHPVESVGKLKELTGRSDYEARRLLISEVSRVQTEAKKLSYDDNDILEYKYLAIIDDRTTHTCKSLHGKVFKVSEMKVGVNAPPMHQFCRSTTIPVKRKESNDWEDEDGDLFIDDEQIEAEADAENEAVLSDINDILSRLDKMDNNQIKKIENKLEQAKKLGKKVNITDQAIEKVKQVDIPTHTKEENTTIQMLHKQLLKDSKENNESNEVVYFLVDGNLRTAYGNQTEVKITGNDSILLDNANKNSVIMLHNHPGGSSFSLTDLKTLFTTKSIKTLTIVTNQGSVKYITKTEKFDLNETLKIISELLKDVPVEDINRSVIEIVLKRLYTLGMIIFKVR
ncbi:minor capsid protein [Macrococcus sp. DPC7161]|uniref:minor capsid protein n=1 Tax=Macrococcus sp. DPC7161 TaxID=2507060 RepID=UPI00100AFF44|nr:minor capsid protein [Macrococcus sp. DPC7161]RXK19086.1 phage head morphogenesis protein [Macrococcus sp. DPC7161]